MEKILKIAGTSEFMYANAALGCISSIARSGVSLRGITRAVAIFLAGMAFGRDHADRLTR